MKTTQTLSQTREVVAGADAGGRLAVDVPLLVGLRLAIRDSTSDQSSSQWASTMT